MSTHIGTCPDKGKRQYTSRSEARTAARATPGGEDLHAWRCESCGFFHLGHGYNMSREEHRRTAERKRPHSEARISGAFVFDGQDVVRHVTEEFVGANFTVSTRDDEEGEAVAVIAFGNNDRLNVNVEAVPPFRLEDVADVLDALVEEGISGVGAAVVEDETGHPLMRVRMIPHSLKIAWEKPAIHWLPTQRL